MKFFQKNSATILVIILFVAVMMAYKYLWKSENAMEAEAVAVGSDLVELSNTLQSVTLNTDLFSRPAYTSLKEFRTPLQPQPLGRPNPFAEIGR